MYFIWEKYLWFSFECIQGLNKDRRQEGQLNINSSDYSGGMPAATAEGWLPERQSSSSPVSTGHMGEEDSKITISTLGDRLATLFTEIRNTAGGKGRRAVPFCTG